MTDYGPKPVKNGEKRRPFYSRFRPYTAPFSTVGMSVLGKDNSKGSEARNIFHYLTLLNIQNRST
jgi:hypothetical protein